MALNNPVNTGSPNNSSEKANTEILDKNKELEQEYVDKRQVTISLVHNYSNYRRVNMKVLGHRKETIGSSIRSSQRLCANAEEVATYFPQLIGISPSNPDFITRVKAYLSNIQFTIAENDVTLNTTFIYKRKADYLEIKKQEDKINEEYDKANRADVSAIRDALKVKIDALNTLESSKYKYGHPENLEEYLLYRHCLLYNDVAKDPALINSDPSIRFYIKDEAKEAEKQRKLTKERAAAMKNFVELDGTDKKFDAVFIAISLYRGDNLADAMLKDRSIKSTIIMDFVNTNPDKFNKFVNDKYIMMRAFIEMLILRGELVRSTISQQISTPDGTFIASNMNDAIAWFENPNNAGERTKYENKLKLS